MKQTRTVIFFSYSLHILLPALLLLSPAISIADEIDDRLAKVVTSTILHAYCKENFTKKYAQFKPTQSVEDGTDKWRAVDNQGARHEFYGYNQPSTSYLPSSFACRFETSNANNGYNRTLIVRADDINEERISQDKKKTRTIKTKEGNSIIITENGLNDIKVIVYIKGPPEKTISLPKSTELTTELIEQLKTKNWAYFESLKNPQGSPMAKPAAIGQ